jgi:tetratricopeptide (TPR) repeat protein
MPLMIKIKDYMNLGRIYLELSIIKRVKGEYEASLEYIQKSIHTYEQAENYERVSIALNSLANIYLEKGQYSLALENYHKSFELIQNEKRTDFYYLVKHNLARIYIILNFYDKSSRNIYGGKQTHARLQIRKAIHRVLGKIYES